MMWGRVTLPPAGAFRLNLKEACMGYVISRIGGRRHDSTDPSCNQSSSRIQLL